MPRFPRQSSPQIGPSGNAATPYEAVSAQSRAAAGVGQAVAGMGDVLQQIGQERIRRRNALLASQGQSRILDYVYQYRSQIDRADPEQIVQPPNGIGNKDLATYWDEDFQTGLKKHVTGVMKGLPTTVQDDLKMAMDRHLPVWRAAVADGIQNTEKTYWQKTIPAQAIALAGQGRFGEAIDLAEKGTGWMDPAQSEVLRSQVKEESAWASLQKVAVQNGWQYALEVINRPQTQEALGLDADGVGRITNRVQAQAAIAQRQADLQRDSDRAELTRKLWSGELTVDQADQALKVKTLDPSEYSGMMVHLTKPREYTRQQVLEANVIVSWAISADPDNALGVLAAYADRLTPSESAQYVDRIQDAEKAKGKKQSNDAKTALFSGVLRGDIKDLAEVDQAAKDQTITADEQQQLYRIITEPAKPGAEAVLKAHAKVQIAIDDVAARRIKPSEAMKILAGAAGNFTSAEGAGYFKKIQDAVDPANVLASPDAKKGREYLDQLRTAKLFEGKDALANNRKWLESIDDYNAWVEANPKATPEQHQGYLRYLSTPVLMSYFQNMTPAATRSAIRRLPPEAKAQWAATGGVKSDEWIESWRKIKKPLTLDVARHYFQIAGGDKVKAEAMAKEDNYK